MSQPTFAIVSAVYGVAQYLPDFFSSLDKQTYPHHLIRVLLIDDGSIDNSGDLCVEWAESTDFRVEVVRQENAGQAAARNAGIARLRDEDWVTFTDPDDCLHPDYFTEVAAYLKESTDVHLVAGHHMDYWEDDPSRGDKHPLRFRFASGNRTVNLESFPRNFHMHIASSCLRVETLQRSGLKFDDRVKPVFEDAHLLSKYLLGADVPSVAFLASAIYHYRRRSDGSSTMQNAKTDPRRYTDVLEYGTLDLLNYAIEKKGRVPDWVQYLVIYDLTWIYRSEDSLNGPFKALDPEVCARFHQLAGECLRMIDSLNIEAYPDVQRSTAQREAMIHGYAPEAWHWDEVVVNGADEDRGLVKLVYHFTGEAPDEEILVGGRRVAPRHAKTRDFVYLQRSLVHERILWVSLRGTLQIRLNGESVPLGSRWPAPRSSTVRPAQVTRIRSGDKRVAAVALRRQVKPAKRSHTGVQRRVEFVEAAAHHALFGRFFRDAWVLMDRDHSANDNAEHLFRYLRTHRRDINAWFVVRKGTADWNRLKADGYKRVIAHGSFLWQVLCLHATHMVSSHVDQYVLNPFARRGGWRWRYIFLQHGVTQVDLSRWLNTKRIDLFITASRDEYASIAGDGSPYAFTTHEVQRTGLPRYDRLIRLARAREQSNDNGYILVMPTWRAYLSPHVKGNLLGGQPSFSESTFARGWNDLLGNPKFRDLCLRTGRNIVFMPHPNLETYLNEFDMPEGARVFSYGGTDVQQIIAGADVLITDYSSIAFDGAIAGRPLIYYQFDRSEFFGGAHTGRPGYFDYVSDGFGPVAETVDVALDALENVAVSGFSIAPEYKNRVDSTFGKVDGRACERVTRAIEDLGRSLSKRQLRTPVPTPIARPIAVEQVISARTNEFVD